MVDGEDLTTDALLPEAEKARPDLLALVEQIRGQKLNISSAKGAYGPSIGAGASLTDGGTEFDKLGWNWSVSATATWSLFAGLLTYSQVREQKSILVGVEAQVRQMRQQIRFDVEQARLAVNANKANTRATQDALDNARAQLKLAEGRYAQGLGNIVELTDAQVAVTTAAGNRAQADLNLAIARSQLLRALGRT
jgi:outer membrane protein